MANLSDVKNIPKKAILPSTALGSAIAIALFSEAANKVNVDQRSVDGGKFTGRIQIAHDADGAEQPRMVIADGGDPEDDWYVTDATVATITPTYAVAPTVGVGTDLKPVASNLATGLASVPFPRVLQANVLLRGNAINNFEYSGKTRGSVILVDNGGVLDYAISTGMLDNDPWVKSDGTLLTPVGAAIASTSAEASDFKPVTLAVKYLTSVDFPLIASTDLADIDYDELYSEVENTLYRIHDTAVIRDGGGNALALMYGRAPAGSVTWIDLGGVVADVVPA